MKTAYLLIGGNIGDRESNLAAARELISQHCGRISKESSVYETGAWGLTEQPAFLNQALELETVLKARMLMREVLKVEKIMGRVRKEKFGPRIIDIDILLFSQEIHDDPSLRVPHPELQNRRFALLPLAEIAPEFMHPSFKVSIQQLLRECPDQLPVIKHS